MGSRLAQTPQAKGTVSDETAFVPQTSHRFGLGGGGPQATQISE